MSKKDNDKKIVFRRIGGRIVPIAVGAGSIYGVSKLPSSHELSKKVFKSSLYKSYDEMTNKKKNYAHENKKFQILKRLYKKDIEREVGLEHEIPSRFGKSKPMEHRPWANANGFTYGSTGTFTKEPPHKDSSIYKFEKWDEGRPRVVLGRPSHSSFLHELGHAQQYRLNTGLHQKMRDFDNGVQKNRVWKFTNKVYDKMDAWKFIRENEKSKVAGGLKSFINIGDRLDKNINSYENDILKAVYEADAWRRGAKMAKGSKLKMLKKGLAPFSTYLVRPTIKTAKLSAIIGGIGLIGYGLFKSSKENK